MNKKEPRYLKDYPQASGMPRMNVVIGVMIACFIAAFAYSSFAGGGFRRWLERSQPSSSPTNSSQPQK